MARYETVYGGVTRLIEASCEEEAFYETLQMAGVDIYSGSEDLVDENVVINEVEGE